MRILVIEDEPRILAFVSRGLEAEGFTVDAAGDGPSCPW
jgi:two-component system OmpR family response regulator